MVKTKMPAFAGMTIQCHVCVLCVLSDLVVKPNSIIQHINYNISAHFKGFFTLFRGIVMLAWLCPAIGYIGLISIIYAQPAV